MKENAQITTARRVRRRGRYAGLMVGILALSLLAGCATAEAGGATSSTPTTVPTPTVTVTPTPTPPPALTPEATPVFTPEATPVFTPEATDQKEPVAVKTSARRAATAKSYSEENYTDIINQLLEKLTTADMTKRQKAKAIYDYVRTHVVYTGSSDKSEWKKSAYAGFTSGKGDCFTYYACSRALLTASGIDNMEVRRVGGVTKHFWNLVNCGDGWYHFDACPRLRSDPAFDGFMATDQALADFTAVAGRNYYTFDDSLLPARVGGAAVPSTATPAPEEVPAVPESTLAPEEVPAVPETTPAPGEVPAVPESTPAPEEVPAVPETTPPAEEVPAVPETAPPAEEVPTVPETAPAPEGENAQ